MSLEAELINWLKVSLPPNPRHLVDLGDDSAVLDCSSSLGMVVTTDMLNDGIDFLLDEVDPSEIGHKALGVNLSDLAAMAAVPLAVFVSLVLPRQGSQKHSALELAKKLYQGMFPLLDRFKVSIAGGDTNTWDGPLAISVTALGDTTQAGPLTRSGAKPGDQVLVTGTLGGSILGKHLRVEPRVQEALLLHEKYLLHAGIDVSDGLALDISRLANASGVGAVLDLEAIPISEAAHALSEQDKVPPLQHALGDGEDFELVLVATPDSAHKVLHQQPLEIPLTRIGEIVPQQGLWRKSDSGELVPLATTGYQHQAEE